MFSHSQAVASPYPIENYVGSAVKRKKQSATCPSAVKQPDGAVIADIRDWMDRRLHCVAGRREFKRGRYMIRNAAGRDIAAILGQYRRKLLRGEAVACLFVFNEPLLYAGRADTAQAFRYLAGQMAPIAATGVEALIDGGALTTAIRLKCPVTGESTLFDDFECIAFCPQSRDEADPLYDPLMFAPYPCVNLSSDVFAFSSFVADSALSAWGRPVYCEPSPERIEPLLQLCVDRWQRIATKTIRNFEAVTNTALCPVHVGADETYWVAHHKDPAFAERKKEAHAHELPVIYANRIVDAWMRHFRGERAYRAGGLAREGLPA